MVNSCRFSSMTRPTMSGSASNVVAQNGRGQDLRLTAGGPYPDDSRPDRSCEIRSGHDGARGNHIRGDLRNDVGGRDRIEAVRTWSESPESRALFAAFVQNDTTFNPTPIAQQILARWLRTGGDPLRDRYFAASALREAEQTYGDVRANASDFLERTEPVLREYAAVVGAANAAGVLIVAGTDMALGVTTPASACTRSWRHWLPQGSRPRKRCAPARSTPRACSAGRMIPRAMRPARRDRSNARPRSPASIENALKGERSRSEWPAQPKR